MIPEIVAGILVGGQGKRMGSSLPKHRVPFGDEALVDPILRAARAMCRRVVLVGDGPGIAGLEQVRDEPGVRGPLAGILGLMRAYPDAGLLVFACDTPLMNQRALQWLMDQRRLDRMAIFPRTSDGRVHPLGALYEARSREALKKLARDERLGPRALTGRDGFISVDVPKDLQEAWSNVNDMSTLKGLLDSRKGI